ncbi:hypothetical protein [Trinickia acidisoli]|nr:hypothetical protein [Trinickia acidisoli]
MKYLLIALLSSPVLVAYELKPVEMQDAFAQVLRYLVQHLTG